jgi:hypothetical protein
VLWVCDKQNVLPYPGEFDDYKAELMEGIHEEEAALESQLERRMREEEEARLTAARDRARKVKELRLRQAGSSTEAPLS